MGSNKIRVLGPQAAIQGKKEHGQGAAAAGWELFWSVCAWCEQLVVDHLSHPQSSMLTVLGGRGATRHASGMPPRTT